MKLKILSVTVAILLLAVIGVQARRTPDHSLATLRMALAHRRPQNAATQEAPLPSLAPAQQALKP